MSTWNQLYKADGVYQSDIIDISSDFDYYLLNYTLDYEKNDGDVDVQIRTSHDDGVNWSEWKSIIINNTYLDLFDNNEIKMKFTKLQFKVILSVKDVTGIVAPPKFKFLNFNFTGGYKIENTGDLPSKPEIWVKKKNGSGDIIIFNETTGQNVILKDLNNGETVYIDNENKDVKSNLPLTSRYSNHNREWLLIDVGRNIITGEGDFELIVKNEFKLLQG